MKLQLALDRPDLMREMELVTAVASYVDLIEAGTPLLIREGIRAVRELRRRFRGQPIVADIKVVDAGEPIAELAFAAGAKTVTVLGCASDQVIERVVRTARRYDGEVMADSLGVPDIVERAVALRRLGVSSLCLNRRGIESGRDDIAAHHQELLATIRRIELPVFLAGGIDLNELKALSAFPLAGVIIGAAIAAAPVPADAARQMRAILDQVS
ncbi:MAG: orotidine 5'-phosphate decarboxylase / HUMPS family protein [Blastocatellia bacterium]